MRLSGQTEGSANIDELLRAIERDPADAELHLQLGNIRQGIGRFEEAVAAYDAALGLVGPRADLLSNKANSLCSLLRCDEALATGMAALELDPKMPEAQLNVGNALHGLLRIPEAIERCRMAIDLVPNYALAHFNLGNLLLLQGNFSEGLPECEWRWKLDFPGIEQYAFPTPRWRIGESAAGRTILVFCEQGFGDSIQFCRYLPILKSLEANVMFAVPKELISLYRSLEGHCVLAPYGEPFPPFDLHVSLMSLPLEFGTRLDSIPSGARYLQAPDDALTAWSERLGPKVRPRIAVCWSGSRSYRGFDRNRSIPLADFADLFSKEFEWISLQKDVWERDLPALARLPEIRHFGADLRDFGDSAAICELCDAVVSIDTSVAHLACALGRPTSVLVPKIPDWRWMLDRGDSPWYPTARLYRQDASGSWADAIRRIKSDLAAQAAAMRPICT